MIRARVIVSLKEDVMDPEGNAVGQALHSLGHGTVKSIRVGRSFDIVLDTDDEASARETLNVMCEALLANLVIEKYEIQLGAAQAS